MRNRILLIKPASGACNMRCTYCFYADEISNRSIKNYGLMSKETAHIMIDMVLAETDGNVTFSFQGGEPTLSGLDFFKDFVSYAKGKGEGRISFALQTNGYSLDREWASFFHKEQFLIGLSMDGNKKIHDIYRHGKDGKGSFKNVFRASQALTAEKAEFNILITVTKDAAENIEDIFTFLARNGFRYLQFIPCIDSIDGDEMPYSLTPELYGECLKKMFALYYKYWKNSNYVSVRYFDNLISMLLGYPPETCGMSGICGANYVIEADGSVFPCDFYVLDGYKLGNVNDDSFDAMDRKRQELHFIEKSKVIADECRKCHYFPLCRGGCRRDRENFEKNEIGLTKLCPAYKEFFSFALPGLEEIARAESLARMHSIHA